MHLKTEGTGLDSRQLSAVEAGLAAIGADDDGVTVVITDDFTGTVRTITDTPDYGTSRGAGVVGAKTISTDAGSIIVLNAPEFRRRDNVADVERILAHEGGHVLINRRGETVTGRRHLAGSAEWRWILFCVGALALDEFRIERALAELGYPAPESCDPDHFEPTMFAVNAEILDACVDPASGRNPAHFAQRVVHTQDWLSKYLAYAAPFYPAGPPRSGAAPLARANWSDYIGDNHWNQRMALYSTVPSARTVVSDADLDAALRKALDLEIALLRLLGFEYTTERGGEGFWRRGTDQLWMRRENRFRRAMDDDAA